MGTGRVLDRMLIALAIVGAALSFLLVRGTPVMLFFSSVPTTGLLQVVLGAVTGATALILCIVLYVTRADALMGEESPTSLVSRLEERMWDERFCYRALDLLHGAALVNGLIADGTESKSTREVVKGERKARSGRSVSEESTDFSLIRRVVPLLYEACSVHVASTRVVSAAFALLTAISPLEEAEHVAATKLLMRPDGLSVLVAALRRHVRDPRAARCGALSLGITVNASCASSTFPHTLSPLSPVSPPGQSSSAQAVGSSSSGPQAAGPVQPWTRPEDLRDAADACLEACAFHTTDADVQLWCLYALLHLAAADDGDIASLYMGGFGRGTRQGSTQAQAQAGSTGGTHASTLAPLTKANATSTRPYQHRGPVILDVPGHPLPSCPQSVGLPGTERIGAALCATLGHTHPTIIGSRPYTLCAYIGERGGVMTVVKALSAFPADERVASVGILLLGVLVKSRADNWSLLLRTGAFEAVRQAVLVHKSSEKVLEVGIALLSVDYKFRVMSGEGGNAATILGRAPAAAAPVSTAAPGVVTPATGDHTEVAGGNRAGEGQGEDGAAGLAQASKVGLKTGSTSSSNAKKSGGKGKK